MMVADASASATQLDLIDMVRILWGRKLRVLSGGLLGAAIGIGISLSLTKTYQADGNLVVRSDALTAPETEAAFQSKAVNDAVVATEQEVLMSKGLLTRVAAALNIPDSILPTGVMTHLRTWLEAQHLVSASTLQLWFPSDASPMSYTEQRVRFVNNALGVTTGKGSSVINVRAVTADPVLSAAIVNKLMHTYMDDRAAEQSLTAQQIETALRKRLSETQQQIASGEERLQQMYQQPGAVESSDVPEQMQRFSLIGMELSKARVDLVHREAEYRTALQMRAGTYDPDASDLVIINLRKELDAAQADLARAGATRLPGTLPGLTAQVKSLKVQLAKEIDRIVSQKSANVQAAQATVASLQNQEDIERQKRQQESGTAITLHAQRDAVASLWRVSDNLQARLIDVVAHPANPNAHILTEANVPLVPSFPSKVLFAAAGFLVSAGGVMATLLLSRYGHRQQPMPMDVAGMMNVPLLGSIPEIAGTRPYSSRWLLGQPKPRSILPDEALYAVALKLLETIDANKLCCVTVTSAHRDEDKTSVSVALGQAVSSMSKRVLLLDLDLRRPNAKSLLLAAGVMLEQGYMEGVAGELFDLQIDTRCGLQLLTPHQSYMNDPLGFLRSRELEDALALLRPHYDLIVFDTPPAMEMPDALMAGRLSDGIVLVAQTDRSHPGEAAELLQRLSGANRRLIGMIVTRTAHETKPYYGAYGRA